MKDYELLHAIGCIDEKYIRQAAVAESKKPPKVRWGALAACLCLAVGAVASAHFPKAPALKPEADNVQSSAPVETAVEGIRIPAIELPEPNNAVSTDMIGLIVYRGGVYAQACSYYGEDARRIEALVGEYLGRAVGSIDEWSTQDEYAVEFASTYSGEVYAVKGYDTDFRICLRTEFADENGAPTLWIELLDRLNGITVSTGKDLFEDRLHLHGRIASVKWQAHDDWNYGKGNFRDASFEDGAWERFLEALDQGEFFDAWVPEGAFYEAHPFSSIYDTPNQAHLFLSMQDGTSVMLRLIEGGYVGYDATGWRYFVRLPAEVFDPIYDACGGTHLTGWEISR